jgi:hypothetical protein
MSEQTFTWEDVEREILFDIEEIRSVSPPDTYEKWVNGLRAEMARMACRLEDLLDYRRGLGFFYIDGDEMSMQLHKQYLLLNEAIKIVREMQAKGKGY